MKILEPLAATPSDRMRVITAREKRWIEEVRRLRFARIASYGDAERFADDFRVPIDDVLAACRNWKKELAP
jgi:hypothetical protein